MVLFAMLADHLSVAVLQSPKLSLRHDRQAISHFEELIDILLNLIQRLQVQNAPILTRIDVTD